MTYRMMFDFLMRISESEFLVIYVNQIIIIAEECKATRAEDRCSDLIFNFAIQLLEKMPDDE